jgi:hypothetical protein
MDERPTQLEPDAEHHAPAARPLARSWRVAHPRGIRGLDPPPVARDQSADAGTDPDLRGCLRAVIVNLASARGPSLTPGLRRLKFHFRAQIMCLV